ncbi:MAG: hypothetical protein CUN49_11365 [Candidatus Thermofonsia Clade 1 bacterium]|uniref:ABC transporter permease n=1 Tax=Candidatus Thermofonsia Clade 1 bacterium TaxID=2364210 RepID=A0A2M8PCK4_9CHLR|nr:MAG: hypothetical protein CUN49_11365 [Candidatus Thermofonsia Clade 1 bacterium]
MFRIFRFALKYAVRNLRRDRQRTLFALISIAAGVSTVVALRALGLMLTDALTSNAQATLRGDILIQRGMLQVAAFGSGTPIVNSSNYENIVRWAAERNYAVTFALSSELMQAAVVRQVNGALRAERPAFVIGHFIDPKVYPFYDVIRAEQPRGALLRDLITAPNQVVVSKRLADQLGIQLGDSLRVGTAQALQTVVGIVPDSAESGLNNINTVLFSFIYIDRAALADFGLDPRAANEIYLKLPEGVPEEAARAEINVWRNTRGFPSSFRLDSAQALLARNTLIADTISRFVLILSLVGLVIGGVGIINTMFVNVNRRAGEIAVLKTIGLKGRQVSLVFLIEAILLGLLGSLLGAAFGVLLSLLARNFGEQAFNVALPWRVYLDPLVIGIALGMAITVCFAFLPTLLAGQVRPLYVLRAEGIPLARAGCLPSLLTLLVLNLGLGSLVDLIINSNRIAQELRLGLPISLGIIGVFVTFALLGIVIGVMWLLVWLLSKLPSFRNANLRLALRGLTQHRLRTALSLLALIIGMTSLSGTLIMTRSINTLLYTSLSEPLGGNMIVLPLLPVQALVRAQLDSTEGVRGYREVRIANADLVAINGNRNVEALLPFDENDPEATLLRTQLTLLLGVNVYGAPKRGQLVVGRHLTAEDSGKNYIVLPYHPRLEALGVRLGSTLTYRLIAGLGGGAQPREQTFEVVGLVAPDARAGLVPLSLGDSAAQVPLNSVPAALPFDLIIADVAPSALNEALGKVGTVAGLFVFDISLFDSIITRLLTQLAALPLLIAVLSLFAAAALIATTVSLATLERRRQIGVMKAVGVKRRYVLAQLLIENGAVGLLGGLISLLPTMLILAAVPALTQNFVQLPIPWDLIGLMLLTAIAVTLSATILTAAPAASEPPLAVLRYE